jgi:hypothetical protein
MPYDEGLAQIMRDDLCDVIGISEKKMFGGIAFMYAGHMVCGSHKDGAMFRVGKNQETEAKAIEGAGAMMFTGRKMGCLIDVTDEAFVDDDRRAVWMGMALRHAQSLPPKP